MDPRVPTKWYLLSGGQVVGEAAEITMPTTFRFLLNSNSSGWALTSIPCLFRVVIPYGGYEEKVTYPVDQEKTNGYVTITKASGDNASFKQYDVHINKGYDFDDYIKLEGLATTNDKIQFPADTTAESLGIGGLRMYADKTKVGYKTDGTEPLTPDDITSWIEPATISMSTFIIFNWPNGQAAVWMGS